MGKHVDLAIILSIVLICLRKCVFRFTKRAKKPQITSNQVYTGMKLLYEPDITLCVKEEEAWRCDAEMHAGKLTV